MAVAGQHSGTAMRNSPLKPGILLAASRRWYVSYSVIRIHAPYLGAFGGARPVRFRQRRSDIGFVQIEQDGSYAPYPISIPGPPVAKSRRSLKKSDQHDWWITHPAGCDPVFLPFFQL